MTKLNIFNDLDQKLSALKRWSIADTIRQQSVAEHCFNVERIAIRLAEKIFHIHDIFTLYCIFHYAHHHDDDEALFGDTPTMAKPFLDKDGMREAAAEYLVDGAPTPMNDVVKSIVKIADVFDGWHFLSMEYKMGNTYLDQHYLHEKRRVEEFIYALFDDEVIRRQLMQVRDEIDSIVSRRISPRGA